MQVLVERVERNLCAETEKSFHSGMTGSGRGHQGHRSADYRQGTQLNDEYIDLL